jgi:ATP-dependent helicase Lhr and Lhr-like helicase
MALALQHRGTTRHDWEAQVGGVPAFRNMDPGHVALILAYMVETDILRDDHGVLWFGRRGEEEYGWRHFMEIFTAFISDPLVGVRHGDQHIGTVHMTTFSRWPEGEVVLVLGGRSWRVTHVDWKGRFAYVVPSDDHGRSRWAGSAQAIRYELCQAMRDVLIGCDLQATISQRAEEAFDNLRQDFSWIESGSTALVRKDDSVRWWTFGGLHANAALAARLKTTHVPAVPNNLSIRLGDKRSTVDIEAAVRALRDVSAETLWPEVSAKALEGLKFSACLPPDLATRVLQTRMTDFPGIRKVLSEPVRFIVERPGESSPP